MGRNKVPRPKNSVSNTQSSLNSRVMHIYVQLCIIIQNYAKKLLPVTIVIHDDKNLRKYHVRCLTFLPENKIHIRLYSPHIWRLAITVTLTSYFDRVWLYKRFSQQGSSFKDICQAKQLVIWDHFNLESIPSKMFFNKLKHFIIGLKCSQWQHQCGQLQELPDILCNM